MQIRNTLNLFFFFKSGVSPPSPFGVFDTCFVVIDRWGFFLAQWLRMCELPNKRGTSRGSWGTALFIDFVLVGHMLENKRLFNFFLVLSSSCREVSTDLFPRKRMSSEADLTLLANKHTEGCGFPWGEC